MKSKIELFEKYFTKSEIDALSRLIVDIVDIKKRGREQNLNSLVQN